MCVVLALILKTFQAILKSHTNFLCRNKIVRDPMELLCHLLCSGEFKQNQHSRKLQTGKNDHEE